MGYRTYDSSDRFVGGRVACLRFVRIVPRAVLREAAIVLVTATWQYALVWVRGVGLPPLAVAAGYDALELLL